MSDNPVVMEGAVRPIPLSHDEQIVMGHRSGGKMSHDLIAKYFTASFDNPALRAAYYMYGRHGVITETKTARE